MCARRAWPTEDMYIFCALSHNAGRMKTDDIYSRIYQMVFRSYEFTARCKEKASKIWVWKDIVEFSAWCSCSHLPFGWNSDVSNAHCPLERITFSFEEMFLLRNYRSNLATSIHDSKSDDIYMFGSLLNTRVIYHNFSKRTND